MYKIILVFFTLITNSSSFTHIAKRVTIPRLHFLNNEHVEDLNIIRKFQNYFYKDNYNNIIHDLTENKLSKVFVNTNYKQIVAVENYNENANINSQNHEVFYNHYHVADVNPLVLPNLVEKTSEHNIPIYFENFTPESIVNLQNVVNELFTIANYAIPALFFILLVTTLGAFTSMPKPPSQNQKKQNNNNPFFMMDNFLQQETEFVKPNVTLESWVGSPEVVEECKEIISYIENKEKYKKIGADMPKGILLEGPPGTGKTLLAKAIAGETNSTFISIAGSEFVELYVGMGASRVRDLFDSARENKPSIIFIDEIDAVGRQRGAGINMANDEREQTLNQLLYEMDGFNNNDDIVVMAATNRKDVLDQALLRPGRFDRLITVSLPDKVSREKILSYYLQNKPTDTQFDISSIAELTDGFSGAQLKNLINEAAILSVRQNYTTIQEGFVFDAFEKLIVGLIRKNATVAPETKERVALHESGHSLLVLAFNETFNFQKASIQPTYNGAGGYTIFSEKPEIKEGGLYTKDLLKKRLIISMGGKAAESIYYGNDFVSLGAIQDLKQANNLAKRMVGNFGMGDKLEVFFNEDVGDESSPFLGRALSMGDKYSEHTRYIMDKESLDLVKEAYSIAKELLEKNRDKLIEFSQLLQNSTVIYSRDIEEDKFIL